MRDEVREKLADALESGRYPQTFGRLGKITRDEMRCFCALGVLCDISELGEWEATPEDVPAVSAMVYRLANGEVPGTVDAVLQWAGVTQEQANKIVFWNDTLRLPFAEIAERLRASKSEGLRDV